MARKSLAARGIMARSETVAIGCADAGAAKTKVRLDEQPSPTFRA
jgi:hypothetical protein